LSFFAATAEGRAAGAEKETGRVGKLSCGRKKEKSGDNACCSGLGWKSEEEEAKLGLNGCHHLGKFEKKQNLPAHAEETPLQYSLCSLIRTEKVRGRNRYGICVNKESA